MNVSYIESPIGLIEIRASETQIQKVSLVSFKGLVKENELTRKACLEIKEYFEGKRKEFDLELEFSGTPFQNKVWKELQKVPFGEVVSYQELARRVGGKSFARAVGGAVHRNPFLLMIPCHRVVGSHGLGGFACGTRAKEFLLEHERNIYNKQ